MKFTDKGHIHFKVSCANQFTQNEYQQFDGKTAKILTKDSSKKVLMFDVEDTGVGIEPDKLNKLFKAFGKLDDKAGLNKHGVGLGLMISKDIINSLQGKISIESVVG